jgi:hypothetical protein
MRRRMTHGSDCQPNRCAKRAADNYQLLTSPEVTIVVLIIL